MVEIDDKLLDEFFHSARQPLEDKGFTERVMRQLPDRALLASRLWTVACVVLGAVLFLVFDGWITLLTGIGSLVRTLVSDVHPVPLFVAAGVLSCLAVLGLVQRMEQQMV